MFWVRGAELKIEGVERVFWFISALSVVGFICALPVWDSHNGSLFVSVDLSF